MAVLSLSKGVVWQAGSGAIRPLIAEIDSRAETHDWLTRAEQNFELFKHYPLNDATPQVLADVKAAAARLSARADHPEMKNVYDALVRLISEKEASDAP